MTGIGKPTFELTDHEGQKVTEASYNGRWLMVYFGFTHCRVVCPRSLKKLSTVLASLPDKLAAKLQPLYISVDPERDSPEVMKHFLEDTYPCFTGLTGTARQVDAAKAAFKVFAQRKSDREDPDGYAVPHTSITYLIDPDGDYAAHWVETREAADIVADLIERLV